MPIVTLQLGQCGNQLGCSFFESLASELSVNDHGRHAADEFFRPIPSSSRSEGDRYCARAILVDMEPKVVNSVMSKSHSGGWWKYSNRSSLCMQSGSGNNWAHGFHGYGPSVKDKILELVRREVEACDSLDGFSLLQSMAGGTGAGLGTYAALALRDHYPSSHIVNLCVWPYETGEVIVQSYNTLLTLSHLAEASDGVVLMSNESLHRLCVRLHNIPRPSFEDMNHIASRALASLLLPSHHRPLHNAATSDLPSPSTAGRARTPQASSDPRSPHFLSRSPSLNPHSRSGSPLPSAPEVGSPRRRFHLLHDLVSHLCTHPHYRLLTLRSVPQIPAASIDFSTFSWPALTKRVRQMQITGGVMEEGLNWSLMAGGDPRSKAAAVVMRKEARERAYQQDAAQLFSGMQGRPHRALASWLVLRGQGADEADVSDLCDPGLYSAWSPPDPLAVSSSPTIFGRCSMSAAMLSNDQSCISPISKMLERAYQMFASRAYAHQYESFGLGLEDFKACFAHTEEILLRYQML